jgi:hypothetical protein
MMDHNKFNDWHPNSKYKLQNGGFGKAKEDGTLISSRGVELAILRNKPTKQKFY